MTKEFILGHRVFRLCLDALLLLAFVLVLSPRLTGLPLHEWIGIALCGPLVVHILLSWRWVGKTTKRLLKYADRRTRVNYCLNATLFVLMTIELASGLVISQVAVPFIEIGTINDRSWRALHNMTLNWTKLVAGLHIAMNWNWIALTARRHLWASEAPVEGRVRIAPSFPHAVLRGTLIVFAGSFVAVGAFAFLGRPSIARLYVQDEIARFAPTLGHGFVQFTGEALLVGLVAYVGRRWLHVRL